MQEKKKVNKFAQIIGTVSILSHSVSWSTLVLDKFFKVTSSFLFNF